ncbi:carbamoyltransferase HypF [Neobacillus sp. SM06]|uniref:carbamoyltransferase HypF n=1 Tax=Neobacillus sp. SM06 TaxID=3422492 RepID=UPI003D2BAD28
MHIAVKIAVSGRVQGVGFRPFIFQLAKELHLNGTVQNNMDGVKIYLEGESEKLQQFQALLANRAPRLSKIDSIAVEETESRNIQDFKIIESERRGTSTLVIPTDSAVCDDCLKEMHDPTNFRYRYPFINCTQCGPRYTIIEELPYDRPFTTMKNFPMCPDCKKEYENPENRRHHAQPIACPTCGPKVQLLNDEGTIIDPDQPIKRAIKLLNQGKIIAIKGIGGYHLSCDARNEQAVQLLRERKKRPQRPLAVMASSIEAVRQFADFGDEEETCLSSPEAPIVILAKNKNNCLAASVAPGMSTVGTMLPYTPLHHLLFEDPGLSCLVMTSANPSGMPILYQDDKAEAYLKGIADYILVHNREIMHPVDDSVVQLTDGGIDFLRRSRGYVPDPLVTKLDVSGIVAFGGQQKSTFTIGRNHQIFVGPHIGDLENVETIQHYHQEFEHLIKWIDTPKKLAVVDAHPGYTVHTLAEEYGFAEVVEVQHHHAHMAACMEEHQILGKAYGIILDGTGYGLDGKIWGFELFYGDAVQFERIGHLHYTPLPGGEKCILEPWRNAAAMLISFHGEEGNVLAKTIFSDKTYEIDILRNMINKKINSIEAGTCGRLFDAVSALCGITKLASYDGEAAIRLAELADMDQQRPPYPFEFENLDEGLTITFSAMLKEIATDVLAGVDVRIISNRFHETVVQAIVSAMEFLHDKRPKSTKSIVLSGGSMHNRYLRRRLTEELSKRSFNVFFPKKVPCNDGGLSYGQLVVAAARRRANQCVLVYQEK